MSIFGSGFGKSNNPLNDLTRTIIQKPPFPKKTRKKACDFKRTVSDSELRKGDVIGVHRIGGVYDHYGIYTGMGKVIHFSNEGSDFSSDICVRRATLSQFKDDASNVFIIDFEAYRDYVENPDLFDLLEGGIVGIALRKLFGSETITIYSPEETVKRAESQLGKGEEREDKYNIIFNNCEHFAVWCKTGVHESSQVQRFIEALGDPTVR